jgi:hypothetical protein
VNATVDKKRENTIKLNVSRRREKNGQNSRE